MDDCCADKSCELEKLATQKAQRTVLTVVLALNATISWWNSALAWRQGPPR